MVRVTTLRRYWASGLIGAGMIAVAAMTTAHAQTAAPQVSVSEQEAAEIARDSYIYAYPLILQDFTRLQTANFAEPSAFPHAPPNQFSHARAFPPADMKVVIRMNVDTLYSSGWLDLGPEPVVLSVPSTDRYFMLPMLSLWTDVFAVPGTRTTGRNRAVNFLVAGPKWQGHVPADLKLIRAPTRYVGIIGRTQTNGPTDYDNVRKIQDQFKLTPLSAWGKADAAPQKWTVDTTVDMTTPAPDLVNRMSPATFFERFADLLIDNPPNQVDYLGSLLKSSLLHLTGNPDSVYVDYFFDTSKGPIILEVPVSLPGFLDDMWQRPVADIIPQISPNGRYLIVPPDWGGTAPEGFVVAKPRTFVSWMLLRGAVDKDGSTTTAVAEIKKMKIYPLSELGKQPSQPLEFFDISDSGINRIPPEGLQYFERLGQLVETEHPLMQDPYVMGMLSAIGMDAGKPFTPDTRLRHILSGAAQTGQAMARTLAFRNEESKRLWPDRKFVMPFIGGDPNFTVDGRVLHDARAYFFYAACGTSELMTTKTPGVGQAYPSGEMTGDGEYLVGDKAYKLHLPPNIPAKLYWSITLYDTETRSILQNGDSAARLSTFTNPVPNADGSYDLYFGPRPLPGKDKNFVKTVPGKGWFFLFRLYGPEKEYFDGAWKPADLVEVAG